MLLTKPLKFLLSPVLNVKNILLMKHNNFLWHLQFTVHILL
jgi:hypothetical protein